MPLLRHCMLPIYTTSPTRLVRFCIAFQPKCWKGGGPRLLFCEAFRGTSFPILKANTKWATLHRKQLCQQHPFKLSEFLPQYVLSPEPLYAHTYQTSYVYRYVCIYMYRHACVYTVRICWDSSSFLGKLGWASA